MKCSNCVTVQEKARCLSIAAKASQEIGEGEKAVEYATAATEVNPVDSDRRLHLIELLRATNNRSEALKHARIGRINNPSDTRFNEVIQTMAELDIMAENK